MVGYKLYLNFQTMFLTVQLLNTQDKWIMIYS